MLLSVIDHLISLNTTDVGSDIRQMFHIPLNTGIYKKL
jgi:hypothetical protein